MIRTVFSLSMWRRAKGNMVVSLTSTSRGTVRGGGNGVPMARQVDESHASVLERRPWVSAGEVTIRRFRLGPFVNLYGHDEAIKSRFGRGWGWAAGLLSGNHSGIVVFPGSAACIRMACSSAGWESAGTAWIKDDFVTSAGTKGLEGADRLRSWDQNFDRGACGCVLQVSEKSSN